MSQQPVAIVGILNVTPDSFVDGGKYANLDDVVARALQCAEQGADIIEIGGESTGPGSLDVALQEELRRVIPAVEAVRKALPDARIAVDTWKADVARVALLAGASLVNDITAGRGDAGMFPLLAKTGAQCVLMYSKDSTPRTTVHATQYADVIGTISAFLRQRMDAAELAGIRRDHIIIDPGLGHFVSADPVYSFRILDRLAAFASLAPVLVSPSRKSFLAGPQNLPVDQRLPATLAASVTAMRNGAAYIRTHDIAETKKALEDAAKNS